MFNAWCYIYIPNSDTLSKGSSVTGTTTDKITQADIDAGSVSNLATATGLVNGNKVTSNNAVGVVLYEHPEHHQEHSNNGRDLRPNYGGAFIPPMMSGSPVYGSPMYSNPMSGSGPSYTTEAPNLDLIGSKAKASLNKNTQKNHSKHHKTGKRHSV